MKNLRPILFILAFALLAYSPAFFRPLPYGTDSFYFLTELCGKRGFETQPIGAILAFQALPCDITTLRVMFFLCCAISALFASKLGKLYHEKGWLAGIFVFATPLWLLEFWKFENDGLAYPLLFAGAYFFYKGLQQETTKPKLFGIFLVLVAQTIWEGSFLWLIAFSLSWFWIAAAVLPALFIRFQTFAEQIIPHFNATESLPAYGLLYQMFLFTALMFVTQTGTLIAPISFFILIAFINAKYAIHASYLLAIAATFQFSKATTAYVKYLPLAGAIIVTVFLAFMSPDLPPDSQEMLAACLAVSEAEGQVICNDWSTGYWIEWFGGKPLAKGGGEQLCTGCQDCTILSYREFDCEQINEGRLKVYRC